ncbi:MAG: hypothetical protein K2P51_04870 [Rhabdochlamydiaceae bacterium]|nr:hypothetical protein [Rhabdochlamydiaceae bacterium]
MSLATSLHKTIVEYNVLKDPTDKIGDYLKTHPMLHKSVMLINHLFRAVAMTAFCFALPFSAPINIGICFAGSLFYRLTVETHCSYKFALPAFAGSLAMPLAQSALPQLVSGVAFASMNAFSSVCLTLLPMAAYLSYVVLTVSYDIESKRL